MLALPKHMSKVRSRMGKRKTSVYRKAEGVATDRSSLGGQPIAASRWERSDRRMRDFIPLDIFVG